MILEKLLKDLKGLEQSCKKNPKSENERIDLVKAKEYNRALRDVVDICALHRVSGCNIGYDCKRYENRSYSECKGCNWYYPLFDKLEYDRDT